MCICVHFVTFIDTENNLTDDNTPYATVSDEMARKNNQCTVLDFLKVFEQKKWFTQNFSYKRENNKLT